MAKVPTMTVRDFRIYKGFLNNAAQTKLVEDVREVVTSAPLFSPMTPYGRPMSVQMTSAGRVGWVSDRSGYRYEETHPSGANWPAIPESIMRIWTELGSATRTPDCCLINFYREGARMGLHQDKDEGDFSWPVVSISLGDDALFRMGGSTRAERTESLWLSSGDVVVLAGDARLAYHGVDRVKHGTSFLLPNGGRLNLTLRVVDF